MRVTGYIPIFSPDDLKVTAVLYRDGTSISSGTTDFKGDGAGTQVTMTIPAVDTGVSAGRSEEHTSELQSLMRISYAVFCLKKKTKKQHINYTIHKIQ